MAAQETTTPQPKERIIFDADSYYGTEGENMAVEDIMERYGITEEEVREQASPRRRYANSIRTRKSSTVRWKCGRPTTRRRPTH